MNDTPIKTPTLDELRKAGYVIDIRHNRLFRTARIRDNGTLEVKTFLRDIPSMTVSVDDEEAINPTELLAKGGVTEIWVTDPETSAEFYGFAKCHPDDNYDKRAGVNESMKRVAALMMVMDGTDDFKCRLQL
jgi:hypothetical protein